MVARRRLIVGSAGGNNAFGTIRSLREHYGDSVFVVAIDTNPRELVGATVIADAFVRVPAARTPQFIDALNDLARAYPDSGYLPLHDEEIDVATGLASAGRFPSGLVLIAPSHEVARLCCDKWEMHRWLAARGLPSPDTALADPAALPRMRQPVILKPREGTGGGNFRRIAEPSHLADVDPSRWILQEALRPPYGCAETFLSRDGKTFRCVFREFIERRPGGPSTKARVYDDPATAALAERLARGLPFFGAFNFEVMTDRSGGWRIIDVNPRISASTRMCATVGVDFAAAQMADFWGEPTESMLPPLDRAYHVVRQYEDYLTGGPRPGRGSA